MQSPLKIAARYFTQTAQSVAADWNRFWYTPANPGLLGVIRIMTGLMLVYTHAVWGLALRDFYSSTGWLSPALVRRMHENQYHYSFWYLVPDGWIWLAYALSMAVFALFTLGLFTRVTSILSLLAAVSYANRAPAALFGLDQINIMLNLYLAIGPSGAAFSLDRWLARKRSGSSARRRGLGGRQSRDPVDPGAYVCDLLLCGHLQAAGPLLVGRRGDVAGVCQFRVSIARHDLAGVASVDCQRDVALLHHLGDVFLRARLAEALATAGASWSRGAARRHRRVPGDVDIRADHAGWVCVVLACGSVPEGPRRFTSTARTHGRNPRKSPGGVSLIDCDDTRT